MNGSTFAFMCVWGDTMLEHSCHNVLSLEDIQHSHTYLSCVHTSYMHVPWLQNVYSHIAPMISVCLHAYYIIYCKLNMSMRMFPAVLILPHSSANKFQTSLLTFVTYSLPTIPSFSLSLPFCAVCWAFNFVHIWQLPDWQFFNCLTHRGCSQVLNYGCWLASYIHELENWSIT